MKSFQKLGKGGGKKGGGGSNEGEGQVAAQPAETWHWDAVGEESGRGKGLFVLLLLLLFAGAGAAAGWYFFIREDKAAAPVPAATAITPKQFVARLEPLLLRSAKDRGCGSRAVTGVGACSIAPGPAAAQIRQTIQGRRAVLRQVRACARRTQGSGEPGGCWSSRSRSRPRPAGTTPSGSRPSTARVPSGRARSTRRRSRPIVAPRPRKQPSPGVQPDRARRRQPHLEADGVLELYAEALASIGSGCRHA